MEKKRRGNVFRRNLILMTIIPLLIAGVLFVYFAISTIRNNAQNDMNTRIRGVCYHLRNAFQTQYPSGYEIRDGKYYAGGREIAGMDGMMNSFKKNFEAEVSIFFDDERVLTTIQDSKGDYIVGTKLDNDNVYKTVMNGAPCERDDAMINGEKYYAEYIPLYDGSNVKGIVFAGVSNAEFNKTIKSFYWKIGIFGLCFVVVVGLISAAYANKISRMLAQIKNYLGKLVKKQTSDVSMDKEVLERNDEIGDLGRYAMEAGEQLKLIVGLDPLTGVFNRRTGRQYLEVMWDLATKKLGNCTLCMCDIDFFKRFNDEYGHDMGDEVLRKIGQIFKESTEMNEKSFVIRWGGEEFLIGLSELKPRAVEIVEGICKQIKELEFRQDDKVFGVTVTFGISTYFDQQSVRDIIAEADANLYKGKESGRDRIIY